jgi:polyhydroxyalkanoate synthesis regulator phasin
MARNQGILEEGRERFEGALKDMERDWKRLQKRADQGRKQFEQQAQRQVKKIQTGLRKNPLVKRAEEQRKQLERRARKLGNELRNSTAVKRAESLRKDAETRFEEQLQSLFGLLRIASASEVTRLERKVDQLGRKLRELEKGAQAAA